MTRPEVASSFDDVPPPVLRSPQKGPIYPDLPPIPERKSNHRPPSVNDHPYLARYCRDKKGRSQHLATLLGVHPAVVCMWIRGKRRITVRRCYQIEEITKGLLTCEMLRPDLRWKRLKYNTETIHEPDPSYVPPLNGRQQDAFNKFNRVMSREARIVAAQTLEEGGIGDDGDTQG